MLEPDNSFYLELLDYLEKKYQIHWNNEYDLLGERTSNYIWYIEDRDLTGTFPTLKELVEDILSKFIDIPSRDY